MQEKIIEELRQELKAQTDENQELLKINEEHQRINGELRIEIDGLITIIDLVKEHLKKASKISVDDYTGIIDFIKELKEILERVNEE